MPTTSLYGQWKVMEAARAAGVIVLLDGQGADEVLGGYHKFMACDPARPRAADRVCVGFGWAFARQIGGPRVVLDAGRRYLGRAGSNADLAIGLRGAPDAAATAPAIQPRPAHGCSSTTSSAGACRTCSRTSIGARWHSRRDSPPVPRPVVASPALAMPPDVLWHDGWSKWPLRQTLADRGGEVPAWRRGKRWFGVPQRVWLRGPLAPFVDQWRRAPHPLWPELVDPEQMRQFGDAWVKTPTVERRRGWTDLRARGARPLLQVLDRRLTGAFTGHAAVS